MIARGLLRAMKRPIGRPAHGDASDILCAVLYNNFSFSTAQAEEEIVVPPLKVLLEEPQHERDDDGSHRGSGGLTPRLSARSAGDGRRRRLRRPLPELGHGGGAGLR